MERSIHITDTKVNLISRVTKRAVLACRIGGGCEQRLLPSSASMGSGHAFLRPGVEWGFHHGLVIGVLITSVVFRLVFMHSTDRYMPEPRSKAPVVLDGRSRDPASSGPFAYVFYVAQEE